MFAEQFLQLFRATLFWWGRAPQCIVKLECCTPCAHSAIPCALCVVACVQMSYTSVYVPCSSGWVRYSRVRHTPACGCVILSQGLVPLSDLHVSVFSHVIMRLQHKNNCTLFGFAVSAASTGPLPPPGRLNLPASYLLAPVKIYGLPACGFRVGVTLPLLLEVHQPPTRDFYFQRKQAAQCGKTQGPPHTHNEATTQSGTEQNRIKHNKNQTGRTKIRTQPNLNTKSTQSNPKLLVNRTETHSSHTHARAHAHVCN